MTTVFRREMGRNYLVLVGEDGREADYQLRMLADNALEGFAFASIRMQDQRVEVYYDISSKQPLSRMYERQPVTAETVTFLLQQLQRACDIAEQYMLDADRILLNPSLIYMEPISKKLYLCLGFPGTNTLEQGLETLLEFFLDHVSREDYACVGMVYGLYQESQKENVTLLELLEAGEREKAVVSAHEENLSLLPPVHPSFSEKAEQKLLPLQEQALKPLVSKTRNPFWRLRLWTKHIKRRLWRFFHQSAKTSAVTQLPVYTEDGYAGENEQEYIELCCQEGESASGEITTVCLERKEETDFTTRLLEEIPLQKSIYCLRSRFPEQYEDIVLDCFPFIIGTMPNVTDAPQNNRLISRMHTRLEQREDGMVIIDLNSSNGTFVNDVRLNASEEKVLEEGDRVALANQQYIFQQILL